MEGISHVLACNLGSKSFKFLGIPVGANPRRLSTWQPIIDVVRARLSSWKSKQLSIGGRVTLINSVLASLPLYLFSFYKAPKKVIEEITKLQRRFLWGGDEENKKMSWVSWDLICTPKDKGGLGIKNLEAFNLALLTKWRWRIITEGGNSLWSRVVMNRYGVEGRWPNEVEARRNWCKHSLWWRDLILLGEGTNLESGWFERLAKLKVGRGDKARFWTDSWHGMEPFAAICPTIFSRCGMQNATVSEMGFWHENRWNWSWHWANELLPDEAETVAFLQQMLRPVQLELLTDDRWLWSIDAASGFSVKSCYCWMIPFFAGDRGRLELSTGDACKRLWKNDAPSKVLIFGWRVLLDKVASRDALFRRGILHNQSDRCCVMCSNEDETAKHLFLECVSVREVWLRISQWMGKPIGAYEDMSSHFEEFGKLIKGKKSKRLKNLIWLAVIWNVWTARNRQIFKGERSTTSEIVSGIKFSAWSWFKARVGRRCRVEWADWFNCPLGCLSLL